MFERRLQGRSLVLGPRVLLSQLYTQTLAGFWRSSLWAVGRGCTNRPDLTFWLVLGCHISSETQKVITFCFQILWENEPQWLPEYSLLRILAGFSKGFSWALGI